MVATLIAITAGSVVAAEIGPEELASIVKGRKWQVGVGGNLSDPLIQAYWDFNSNGSMCVRPGNLLGTPIGEQYGYKSACVRVEKLAAKPLSRG